MLPSWLAVKLHELPHRESTAPALHYARNLISMLICLPPCCDVCTAGTAQLPPQQAYVTSLQLPPRQQQFSRPLGAGGSSGSSGSSMPRILAAAGTVGGVLGVQVGGAQLAAAAGCGCCKLPSAL